MTRGSTPGSARATTEKQAVGRERVCSECGFTVRLLHGSHGRTNGNGPALEEDRVANSPTGGCVKGRTHSAYNRDKRSEENTSELQALLRSSNAIFCLTKKLYEND